TVEQPFRDFVGAVVVADLLAHEEHTLVALHLFGHGLAQGFAISQFTHGSAPSFTNSFDDLSCQLSRPEPEVQEEEPENRRGGETGKEKKSPFALRFPDSPFLRFFLFYPPARARRGRGTTFSSSCGDSVSL